MLPSGHMNYYIHSKTRLQVKLLSQQENQGTAAQILYCVKTNLTVLKFTANQGVFDFSLYSLTLITFNVIIVSDMGAEKKQPPHDPAEINNAKKSSSCVREVKPEDPGYAYALAHELTHHVITTEDGKKVILRGVVKNVKQEGNTE
jgi:hypothetical protein